VQITENGLLYLFTTIAQCLAGAIALLAAFALYSLQSINKAMSDLCALVVESFQIGSIRNDMVTSLQMLQAEGRYQAFIDQRSQLLANWPLVGTPPPKSPLIDGQLNQLRINIMAHRQILSALWRALLATSILMTASIMATPAAQSLTCSYELAWAVAGTFIVCFVGCLWLFYKLILAALRA
jgi:hypothetical protein